MSKIFRWVSDNAILSIMWSLFGMTVVGFATFQVFWDITKVTAPVATSLGLVYGLPAVTIAAWQWRLGWKDKKECDRDHTP